MVVCGKVIQIFAQSEEDTGEGREKIIEMDVGEVHSSYENV